MTAASFQPVIPPPIRIQSLVVENRVEGHGRVLRLEVPGWPGSAPGQFLMLGPGATSSVPRQDPLLPRPMAVYRDAALAATAGESAKPQIEVLYRVVGRGTTLLAEAMPGDHISLVGPLGRGFPMAASASRSILVGGGTGIASLYELAAELVRQGREVTVLLGARGEGDLIGRGDFEALDAELVCVTEDGTRGEQGLVTQPLAERLAGASADAIVYACGPTPMMRAAAELAARHAAQCYVSLENPMACGFGVCLGCAAPRSEGGFSLVCRQGPVFEASEIDWEGLP